MGSNDNVRCFNLFICVKHTEIRVSLIALDEGEAEKDMEETGGEGCFVQGRRTLLIKVDCWC